MVKCSLSVLFYINTRSYLYRVSEYKAKKNESIKTRFYQIFKHKNLNLTKTNLL
jgi:hypothetical protein